MSKGYFRPGRPGQAWMLLVAFVLALVVGLNLGSTSWAKGPNAKALEKVLEVQKRHTERLMAIEGVVGTATGLSADENPVIKVYTKAPGVAGIPKNLDGVAIEVEATGAFFALPGEPGTTDRWPRPVPIGISTGNEGECSAGTIAARVTDGNVYALSNNHVYALENSAAIGSRIVQPGLYDTNCIFDEDNVIGTLADFVEIEFSEEANNTIDAAIALSSKDNLGTATPSDGYGVPSSQTVAAELEMLVQKYGRKTSLTKGEVTGINATVYVEYDSGVARFVDQIVITGPRFIKAGDSGSLAVTDDSACNPVGLLFAGSISGRTAIANPIDLVLGAFGVTIDDEITPPNEPPTVTISNPADGATFDSGATIFFQGTANDPEDGNLSAGLVWTSNIDGQIGTGGSFSTALSDGHHTVTAEVTDSGGKTGSDSISITVGTPPEVSVTSIVPNSMAAGTTINVTIGGSGFAAGAGVTFEGGEGPAPGASNVVVVNATSITATVTAKKGGPPRNRLWDVRVTNTDASSGLLVDGFTVTP